MTHVSPVSNPCLTVYLVVLYRLVFFIAKVELYKISLFDSSEMVSVVEVVAAVDHLVASEILDL